MYSFQILHIYMCGVCSPPVLGDLTQMVHRKIWKLRPEQRVQPLPSFYSTHHSECWEATPLAINRGSEAKHIPAECPSDLQHSLLESFLLHLSPDGAGRGWKGLLLINVSILASSEVIPTVMHVPSLCGIQFYLSQTLGFLHLEKTTPQLNSCSQLAFQSWTQKQHCPMEGQIPKPRNSVEGKSG